MLANFQPGCTLNGPRYLDSDGKLKFSEVWIGDTLDDAIVGLRAKIFSMGSILSSPIIHDGVIYFGSSRRHTVRVGRIESMNAESAREGSLTPAQQNF